jgi:hypothetical protein
MVLASIAGLWVALSLLVIWAMCIAAATGDAALAE